MSHPALEQPKRPASRFIWVWLVTVISIAGVLFPLFTVATLTWEVEVSWIHGLYQRKFRSLSERPPSKGKRLLIFGGSGTLFGVDAEFIEKELGVPTVNLGTHAALGLDYQIAQIKRTAKKGDSVLMCSELEAYTETEEPTETLREYAFSCDKLYVFSLAPRVALGSLFLSSSKDYLNSIALWNGRLAGENLLDPAVIRHGYGIVQLSPNGDLRGFVPDKHTDPLGAPKVVSIHAKQSLAGLCRWCRGRDIRLLITWPNRMEPSSPREKDAFALYQKLAQFCREQGIPLLGSAEESIFPQELFIDSIYHINEIGRRIHTEKLIAHLRESLKIEAPSGPKTICVLGARGSLVNEIGVFEKQESVEYRYLTTSSLDRPDCITPDELRNLALSGARVTCLDDATEAMALKAGLQSREIRRRERSFSDWVKQYNHHLFLLALVGADQCPVTLENPSTYFARFLSTQGFRVAMVGTGPFSKIHHFSTGFDGAKWTKRRYDNSAPRMPFNFSLTLRSGPLATFDKQNPAIIVENERLTDTTPGLAVAVLDPKLGIVAAKALFQNDRLVEWKLRQLLPP